MGIKKRLTQSPEEIKELKEITLIERFFSGKKNKKQINRTFIEHDKKNINKIIKKKVSN